MELKYFHILQGECKQVTSGGEWAGRSTSFQWNSQLNYHLTLVILAEALQSVHQTRKFTKVSFMNSTLQLSKYLNDQINERLLKGMVEFHQNAACYMTEAMCYLRWTFEVVLSSQVSLLRGQCMFWTQTSFQVEMLPFPFTLLRLCSFPSLFANPSLFSSSFLWLSTNMNSGIQFSIRFEN